MCSSRAPLSAQVWLRFDHFASHSASTRACSPKVWLLLGRNYAVDARKSNYCMIPPGPTCSRSRGAESTRGSCAFVALEGSLQASESSAHVAAGRARLAPGVAAVRRRETSRTFVTGCHSPRASNKNQNVRFVLKDPVFSDSRATLRFAVRTRATPPIDFLMAPNTVDPRSFAVLCERCR